MPWASIKGLVLLCIVLGVYLWFRRTAHIMRARQESVQIAEQQRQAVRANAEALQGAAFTAVLERSESIYTQAADMYTQALGHPLYWLPATIMGYRPLNENDRVAKN